jgi:hypothetical protein
MLNEGMCQKYTDTVRPANIKQSAMPGSITFRYHETIVDTNFTFSFGDCVVCRSST